jgi:hypothetical protein
MGEINTGQRPSAVSEERRAISNRRNRFNSPHLQAGSQTTVCRNGRNYHRGERLRLAFQVAGSTRLFNGITRRPSEKSTFPATDQLHL